MHLGVSSALWTKDEQTSERAGPFASCPIIARRVGCEIDVDSSGIFHCASGTGCRFPGIDGRVSGPHPERLSYGSFVSFKGPDGNGWLLQEVTERLPGRA